MYFALIEKNNALLQIIILTLFISPVQQVSIAPNLQQKIYLFFKSNNLQTLTISASVNKNTEGTPLTPAFMNKDFKSS